MGNHFSVWIKFKLVQPNLICTMELWHPPQGFLEKELPEEVKKEARISFLISPVVYIAAIIISFWFPVISIVFFIVTPMLYLVPTKLDKYLP